MALLVATAVYTAYLSFSSIPVSDCYSSLLSVKCACLANPSSDSVLLAPRATSALSCPISLAQISSFEPW